MDSELSNDTITIEKQSYTTGYEEITGEKLKVLENGQFKNIDISR